MKRHDCDQRTPEWGRLRLGKLTGSCIADAFATIKDPKKEAAGRRNLRTRLVLERITGVSQESGYSSFDMERGADLEEAARGAYESERAFFVEPCGFVEHDDLLAGFSPDGLAGPLDRPDGIVEIKCPKAATHLDYLRGELPREYFLQIVHGLWLTGAWWADFLSFHPGFPPPLRVKLTRILAKDVDLAAHELNVRLFLAECDKEVDAVRALMPAEAVA